MERTREITKLFQILSLVNTGSPLLWLLRVVANKVVYISHSLRVISGFLPTDLFIHFPSWMQALPSTRILHPCPLPLSETWGGKDHFLLFCFWYDFKNRYLWFYTSSQRRKCYSRTLSRAVQANKFLGLLTLPQAHRKGPNKPLCLQLRLITVSVSSFPDSSQPSPASFIIEVQVLYL